MEKKLGAAMVIAWMSLVNTLVKEDILQTEKTPLMSFLLFEKWSTVSVGLGMCFVLEKKKVSGLITSIIDVRTKIKDGKKIITITRISPNL